MKHNANNERIKRKYFVFLKDAKGQSEATIDGVAMALSRFELYTKQRDFKGEAFHYEQAVGFKKYLAEQVNQQTSRPLSKATLNSTCRHLKTFFQWLSMQSGYKSRLNYADMEYFNLSEKDVRVATAKRQKAPPTMEQVKHVINSMENRTAIEKRNRALVAFTLLSGARDSAIASMKLKHVDLLTDTVIQDAREVNTKFSKSFTSYFFPVGDDIREIVAEWVEYLKTELLYRNDEPLFPQTAMRINNKNEFEASGLKPICWSTANPIRTIFKDSFENAGLQYFNPHSFRKTLVGLGERTCRTPEEFKAWSQNLGHEQVLTTFTSYGEVQPRRQSEIFEKLRKPAESGGDVLDIVRAVLRVQSECL
jgi:integrase/recombinase XerD